MPSPSCPLPVIDQSHSQPHPHGNLLLGNTTEPDTDDEEEEEEEEYAARLYLPVTHGKRPLLLRAGRFWELECDGFVGLIFDISVIMFLQQTF